MIAKIFVFLMLSLSNFSYPSDVFPGCDLSVTGIEDKAAFLEFFNELKQKASEGDKVALSKLVIYPMKFNSKKGRKIIKNSESFVKQYGLLFTAVILDVIKKQEVTNLFCRDQGVMFGDGEIWISVKRKKIGIITINET